MLFRSMSGAVVKVYSGSSEPITISVPSDCDEWWDVFTIENGEIKNINGSGHLPPPSRSAAKSTDPGLYLYYMLCFIPAQERTGAFRPIPPFPQMVSAWNWKGKRIFHAGSAKVFSIG